MAAYFCGNAQSHDEHDTPLGQCSGVQRITKAEPVYIERSEPVIQAGNVTPGQIDESYKLGEEAAKRKVILGQVRVDAIGDSELSFIRGYENQVHKMLVAGTITSAEGAELRGVEHVPANETEADLIQYDKGCAQAEEGTPLKYSQRLGEGLHHRFYAGFKDTVEKKGRLGILTPNAARYLMGLKPAEFDPVKVPQHYNTGKIEVTNFISDQGLDFPRGNVVKYVARAGKKDKEKELEDLEKAAAYLQMAYNLAKGLPAVVRDPETREVVWSLFQN